MTTGSVDRDGSAPTVMTDGAGRRAPADEAITLFVNGTLMRGLQLHANLAGADFLGPARTAPRYRLYSIADVHPGMFEVSEGGVTVSGELYRLPPDVWHRVESGEPPGLYMGPVRLDDGRTVEGILYPRELAEGRHRDISAFGDWRAYLDTVAGDAGVDSPGTLPAWVFPWPELDLDWRRAALLVIDVQNYGANARVGILEMLARTHPAMAAYVTDRVERIMVPNIRRLIEGFRAHARDVIYTRHGALLPDGRDLIARRRRRNADAVTAAGREAMWSRGSFEYEILDAIRPGADDLVIDKNASSPFNGTGIDQLLRNLGADTLVLTGTATDMCVETTARDAADRGYDVIVVEDATGTYYRRHHEAALSAIARVYGQIWRTQAVLDALDAQDGARPDDVPIAPARAADQLK